MKNSFFELLAVFALIIFGVALVNPFEIWMPDSVHMLVLALLVVAAAAIGAFVLRERSLDERDVAHRAFAGRAAFLAGCIVLLVAIVIQTLRHMLDPWLVCALITMVIIKIGSRLWSDRYQ